MVVFVILWKVQLRYGNVVFFERLRRVPYAVWIFFSCEDSKNLNVTWYLFGLLSSVEDPWHFGTDLDPRIRNTDLRIRIRLRIRILLFLSEAFKMRTKKNYLGFSYLFRLMMEGSGSPQIMTDPGGPKAYGWGFATLLPRPTITEISFFNWLNGWMTLRSLQQEPKVFGAR